MHKMNDADVMRHSFVFIMFFAAFICSLCVIPFLPTRWSKPVKCLWIVFTVGVTVFAIFYMLYTGTAANGFLD